jgi:hypothetical protein
VVVVVGLLLGQREGSVYQGLNAYCFYRLEARRRRAWYGQVYQVRDELCAGKLLETGFYLATQRRLWSMNLLVLAGF